MITNKEAEEILKREYNEDNYTYLLKNILLPDFVVSKHTVSYNNNIFKSVYEIGQSRACNLTCFEVVLNKGAEGKRVTITQEM